MNAQTPKLTIGFLLDRILWRWKRRRATSEGADREWARWAVTAPAVFLLPALNGSRIEREDLVLTAVAAFGACVTLYSGHILLRKLRFSLMDAILIVILFGNFFGLLLTMPAMPKGLEYKATLAAGVVGWILYGAVIGISRAELLGIRNSLGRSGLLLLSWLTTASLGLVFSGVGLILLKDSMLVSPRMLSWAVPLIVLGGIGLAADAYLTWRCWRAAKQILGEGPLRDEPPPAGPVDRPGGTKVYG